MVDDTRNHTEEHELPGIEAVLACTLALMTGYSQALQAELHPRQRLMMGENITANLVLLVDHPLLSAGFRDVLRGLQSRWRAMGDCTREAAHDSAEALGSLPRRPAGDELLERHPSAPKRLH